ncbi:MAG TPA: thiamine-phosphate kinase [Anaeromyxobacter sp.]|nr:thiamine-phosphate kinase [Anaeromyxobacter sp.]
MATLGEFALIDRITRLLPLRGEGVVLGPGDDCAVLAPPRGEELVATVDEVVEGVHFDRRFTPADIGWKALAVNLSDLASMGARPLWGLVALALPREERAARVLGVMRGVAACARRFGLAVVGGNVSRAPALSVSITAVGAVAPGAALTRAGARPGDLLLGSGTFGDAALGLEEGAAPALARRQRRPTPRLALGRALAGIARAGIDVSDGLVQDLGHVARASRVRAVVEVERLPLSAAYRRRAAGLADPHAAALAGGEDYELLLAVPPGRLGAALTAARRAGSSLSVLGRFERGAGVRVLSGGQVRPAPVGHDHLRAPAPGFDMGPRASRIRAGGRRPPRTPRGNR